MPPASQAKTNGTPLFIACNVRTSFSLNSSAARFCTKRPSAARSCIWPPAMPPTPEARASAMTSAMRTLGSAWVSGRGGQGDVHKGLTIHAFQRRARHKGILPRHLEQGGAFHHQEWPETLAAV